METPNSSMRRVTRSQTAACSSNKNIPAFKLIDDSEQTLSKTRQGKSGKQQQDSNSKSSPLLDITNNSPIVGIAMGSLLTPSSSVTKKRSNRGKVTTPGSGEALLRNQVKTLLQKVEEEAELSKVSLGTRPIFPYLQGFVNSSPMGLLLAPTPANTPQVHDESGKTDADGSVTSALNPNQELISQVVTEMFDHEEESIGSEKSLITRSLLLDFSEKSEVTDASDCSSVLTSAKDKSFTDEDSASVWSIQVNADSTPSEDFEEEEETEDYDNDQEEYNDEAEEEYEEGSLEELCSGIERMSILAAKFEGKHTRFVYNSDDEIEEAGEELGSPSVVKLKGLPTPKGKHMRFPLEE